MNFWDDVKQTYEMGQLLIFWTVAGYSFKIAFENIGYMYDFYFAMLTCIYFTGAFMYYFDYWRIEQSYWNLMHEFEVCG
jgi:hypothetical protein